MIFKFRLLMKSNNCLALLGVATKFRVNPELMQMCKKVPNVVLNATNH